MLGLLGARALPYVLIAVTVGSGYLYVRYQTATIAEQREQLGAQAPALAATRAQADALAHELDIAQSALVARDLQLAQVRAEHGRAESALRRAARGSARAWADTRLPEPIAELLRVEGRGGAGDDEARAPGGAARAVP